MRRTAQASGGLRRPPSIPGAALPFPARCAGPSAASARLWPSSSPEPPPLLTVIDLQGGCEHAAGFGQLDQLTLEQEWQLIEGALDAAIGEGS